MRSLSFTLAKKTAASTHNVSEGARTPRFAKTAPGNPAVRMPAKGEKGELKKSVLQSLKKFQARAKAQEQKNKEAEKTKAHKKGDVEL